MVSRLAKMKSMKESTTKSGNKTRSPWKDQWSAGQRGMSDSLLELGTTGNGKDDFLLFNPAAFKT